LKSLNGLSSLKIEKVSVFLKTQPIKPLNMTIKKFEELIIWQLGKELAKEIYELTKADCWKEDFTFRNQIRSSSGSVPDNIAEGFEREGNNEFVNF
ncbi:MAG TPA: hypothetical protein DCF33_11200, partial [Saprospirales bacterium]|nr:hypothetical protein [Saprospirales bacterium]